MSILSRTVYYDQTGGFVRWRDWAKVITTLGTMFEPFNVNARHSPDVDVVNFDPEDEFTRIDDMRRIDSTQEQRIFSGGSDNPPVMGGVHMPRVGR